MGQMGESGFKDINPETTETIMIPFLTTDMLVNLMTRGNSPRRNLNADYAWHLDNSEATGVARDSWPLRLLPQALRAPIKARLAARKNELAFIHLWEISPHLLNDIGVTFTPITASDDHLIAAPAALVAHVMARGPLPTEPQIQTRQNEPDAIPSAPEAPAKANQDHPYSKQDRIAA